MGTDFLFLSVFGWFRDLKPQEQQNLQALMRLIGYAEGSNKYHTPKLNDDNQWRLIQGAPYYEKFINASSLQHAECCTCATGKAVGPFQIEGNSWASKGFCGQKVTKERQVEWFISIAKECNKVYDRRLKAKDKTFYHAAKGISSQSAYCDIANGHIIHALLKLRGRWKSIPGSGGRHTKFDNLEQMVAKYREFGGVYNKEPITYI